MSEITIKSAFVTGGSKGIGYAIAEALLKRGIHVAISARNAGEVEAAVQKLSSLAHSSQSSAQVKGYAVNVLDAPGLHKAVNDAASSFGGLGLLVANAGAGIMASIVDMTLEQWNTVIETNLTGVFNSVKAALPHLEASKGYLMTISSLAGKNAFAGGAAYNASKFGLNGMSEAMMLDLRPKGIKVSYIMPGSVATGFGGQAVTEADDWKIDPADLAQLVIDLLEMSPRTLPSRVEVRPSQTKSRG